MTKKEEEENHSLNEAQKEQVKQWAKENPRNLEQVSQKVQKEWKISLSKDTIKRILKFLEMSWHRLKRGVAGEPNPEEYKTKKQELEELKQQEDRGEIDLRYVDETGFCLTSYVPYAWQSKGEIITPRKNLVKVGQPSPSAPTPSVLLTS
jgi:hypothetical protein